MSLSSERLLLHQQQQKQQQQAIGGAILGGKLAAAPAVGACKRHSLVHADAWTISVETPLTDTVPFLLHSFRRSTIAVVSLRVQTAVESGRTLRMRSSYEHAPAVAVG